MKTEKLKSTVIVKEKSYSQIEKNQFPIVGIGASAGGLEALKQFFGNMPNKNGMAFVVILHLYPNHVGIMPELLQRITTMPVLEASDGLIVKPNYVYVIPTNKSMSLVHGALFLFDTVLTNGLRLPIDIFFHSLADDRQEKSIGIILSGMGSDGSLGLKAIKEKNGVALVQDPFSANYNSMPLSALKVVYADIVASAEELPVKLVEFIQRIIAVKTDSETERNNNSNLNRIIFLLREQTGQDFSLYQKNTLFSRIERRKDIHKIDKLDDYVYFLKQHSNEVSLLFNDFLIGVTNFFRDVAVWKMLKESVIPAIIDKFPDGYVLRAWVPACSTGEEAYSLAIVFKEAMENVSVHKNLTLQIFATDLDGAAILKARKGRFSKNITADVSPERINRFFTDLGECYCLNSDIRDMVVFATQNVIKDLPFTRLDFLSCRNMLIYLEPELQNKLIRLFNYCLNSGGIMLLGTSETPGEPNEGFKELEVKLRIFKSSKIVKVPILLDSQSSFHHSRAIAAEKKIQNKIVENIQPIADQIILQRFAPTSLLVNGKGDILYITGHTGKYLEPIAGIANWNIFAMASEGLRQLLPDAFRKAMQNYDAVITRNVKIGLNGSTHFADVTVQRIENPDSIKDMIMVVLNDVTPVVEHDILNPKTREQNSTKRLKKMEIEL